ncbi:MAG: acyl-CoA dehydrogenase family protein [Ilumatobacteraceae bacterium]
MADDRAVELASLAEAIADLDHPTKVSTSEWAASELGRRDLVAADADSSFSLDDWRRCAERGIFRMMVPEDQGGAGAGLAEVLLTLEGLGHGCADNGLTFAVASQMLSTQVALTNFASPAQRERWLPGLLDGSLLAALAMTEPGSGSDAFAMAARAVRLDDGSYRIDGHKAYLTFGPVCDLVIVFASTRPEAGSWGISAFLVDTSLPGVRRSAVREKMGMRTTPFGDIELDGVIVPADALLGREGAGARIFASILDIERSYVFAPQVGAMQRHVEASVAFAREREQGGGPIARYQAVSHRIVAMKERHERARLFLYRAAIAQTAGRDVTMAASLAKIVACDTGIESSLDMATIHGARGYVTEFEVERAVRDAVGGLAYSGSTDVLRNVVARLLGLG